MRSIPEQRIAEFQEQDYQLYFGISKLEFDRMLKALHEAYRQEHKRKTRFTKISMMDKLILTLIYRYEYRTMESIAKEYEVSLDTIADNIHWVERTPAPIKPEFTKKILGDEQPITCRFADTLAPEMDKLKAEAAKWATQEEDVLTYAMFPQVAPKFFDKRNAKKQGVDGDHVDYTNQSHPV